MLKKCVEKVWNTPPPQKNNTKNTYKNSTAEENIKEINWLREICFYLIQEKKNYSLDICVMHCFIPSH